MYRQQFYIIANILMALDALIIIGSGYMAYSISLEIRTGGLVMAWNDFLGCVLFMMVANNYFMGRFGLLGIGAGQFAAAHRAGFCAGGVRAGTDFEPEIAGFVGGSRESPVISVCVSVR